LPGRLLISGLLEGLRVHVLSPAVSPD